MVRYIVNGKERTAREIHIGKKFTIVIYRKVKICLEKRIKIEHDKFFGTGTIIYLYLKA